MSATAVPMSEAELQEAIVEFVKLSGYLCYHTFDSRRSEPGYPDLHMVRGRRSVFVELKSERGVLSAAQARWLEAVQAAGHEAYVWRPRDWPGEVQAVLAGRVAGEATA